MKRLAAGVFTMLALAGPVLADPVDDSLAAVKAHHYQQADAIITPWLDKHPQDAEGLAVASWAKYGLHDNEASMRMARRALALDKGLKLAKKQFANSLVARVYELVREPVGLDQAVKEAQDGVALEDTSTTEFALGVALYERGRVTESQSDFDQAMTAWQASKRISIENHEETATSRMVDGIAAFSDGKYTEALNLFNEARAVLVQQTGEASMPYCAMWHGLAAYQLGDYRAAEEDFKTAQAQFGGRNLSLHRLLGDAYLSAGGSLDDAQHEYEAALRIKGDYFQARLGLARVYEKRGDVGLAAATWKSLVQDRPNGVALSEAGDFYRQHDMVGEAIEAYQGALGKLGDGRAVDLRQHVLTHLTVLLVLRGRPEDVEAATRLGLPEDDPLASLLAAPGALKQGDNHGAKVDYATALTYEGPLASDIRAMALAGLGTCKLQSGQQAGAGHLSPDRVHAMMYDLKAWQFVRPGSPLAEAIRQQFEAARQAELVAIQQYVDTQLPLLSMAGGHNDRVRFESDLNARKAGVEALTLGTAGGARAEESEKAVAYVGGTPDELVDPFVMVARQDRAGTEVTGSQTMAAALRQSVAATTR